MSGNNNYLKGRRRPKDKGGVRFFACLFACVCVRGPGYVSPRRRFAGFLPKREELFTRNAIFTTLSQTRRGGSADKKEPPDYTAYAPNARIVLNRVHPDSSDGVEMMALNGFLVAIALISRIL